jgi:putative chitinase
MQFTDEYLRQIMPNCPKAKRALYLPHLVTAMLRFHITTELRIAAFLARLAEESSELSRWDENLNYTAQRILQVFHARVKSSAQAQALAHNPEALANAIYGGRYGNREPGDGWKYHGRSPVQTTFRDNYRAAARVLNLPLEEHPEMALQADVGFLMAGAFWESHGLNALADSRSLTAIVQRINGGTNGLASTRAYYERALRVLPDGFELTEDSLAAAQSFAAENVNHADDAFPDYDISQPVSIESEQSAAQEPENPSESKPEPETTSPEPEQAVDGGGKDDVAQTVEQSAPAKTRTLKSMLSAIVAWFAGIGVPATMFFDRIGVLVQSGDPRVVFVVLIVAVASVLIYWKYQDRQTKLDIVDRQHAHEVNIETMKIRSDPKRINVVLAPKTTPATPEQVSQDTGRTAAS